MSSKQVGYLAVAIWATAQVGLTAGIVTFGVARLDKATATQCRTHDWPASAHKVHMDWCKSNGYITK
jgi:hypothetical protein